MECKLGPKLLCEHPHKPKPQLSLFACIKTIRQSHAIVGYFDCELAV
jgi:hypothetical protein